MTTPDELTSVSAKEREYEDAGFTHNFALTDNAVVDVDTDERWDPARVRIVHEHREEGRTDPGDETVLLALEAPDGTRGTLVTNYGPSVEHGESLRLLGTSFD